MSSDDARASKPQPHILTHALTSSSAPAAVLDAAMKGRVEEFGKKMRSEHALRAELAKVLSGVPASALIGAGGLLIASWRCC